VQQLVRQSNNQAKGVLAMRTKSLLLLFVGICLLLFFSSRVFADNLILSNEKRIKGSLSLIGNDYIEFKTDHVSGNTDWIKVSKKSVLAIVNDDGKIIYPRDKFDENALNFGKVKLRNTEDLAKYRARKQNNKSNQFRNESAEKNRFKVAAIIGGLAGLMVLTVTGGR